MSTKCIWCGNSIQNEEDEGEICINCLPVDEKGLEEWLNSKPSADDKQAQEFANAMVASGMRPSDLELAAKMKPEDVAFLMAQYRKLHARSNHWRSACLALHGAATRWAGMAMPNEKLNAAIELAQALEDETIRDRRNPLIQSLYKMLDIIS